MQKKKVFMLLCGGTLLSGCMHGEAADAPARGPTLREHDSVQGVNPAPPAPAQAPPGDLVNGMAHDLAHRLGVKESALQIVSVQSVVWNDSSLGCPQPEHSYLPAQTPGLRVVFVHEGKPYQYHAAESGHFVYCEHPAVSGLDTQ
jgi:hypothetical protein